MAKIGLIQVVQQVENSFSKLETLKCNQIVNEMKKIDQQQWSRKIEWIFI